MLVGSNSQKNLPEEIAKDCLPVVITVKFSCFGSIQSVMSRSQPRKRTYDVLGKLIVSCTRTSLSPDLLRVY